MLKRIINFFDDKTKSSSPSVTDGATYSLAANMISRDARKVVETLQNAGFDAYIVGGAVRDLLLGIKPKDFDVATNAEPAEVKSLFRRSRIIGRRFQIVHVQFSRELIEVTTFRSNDQAGQDAGKKNIGLRQQSKTGMLTRDNVFGSMHEDASRRDLTVNTTTQVIIASMTSLVDWMISTTELFELLETRRLAIERIQCDFFV